MGFANLLFRRRPASPAYRSSRSLTLAAIGVCLLVGCGETAPDEGDEDGVTTLTVWAHRGKPAEWETIQAQVARFNNGQDDVEAELIEIPEGNYDTQVQSAAAGGDLPDVLELDGPNLANYAWKGYLRPIGDRLDPELRESLLPSIREQGRYAGAFYAVGAFDSGLGLYADRARLEAVDARIPEGVDDAWTIAEFNALLERLAEAELEADGDGRVLDVKRDYRGEWWTYGFSPILVSAGADLIDRDGYDSADGVLNSPDAVEAMRQLQGWFARERVDPNTDGRAFVDRRVAISWVGHWEYPRYSEALGEELVVLPLPDFGEGSRTGMGSWCWSITRNCESPEAAMRFIAFLLQKDEVLAMTQANGAVPATDAAIAESRLYQPDGPLRLFVEQLRTIAVPRPKTPAYPVISSAFREAMLDVIAGGEVEAALNEAVRVIDADVAANEGYPPPEPRE
jgi:multiple sugar transport system substrate-binding protein